MIVAHGGTAGENGLTVPSQPVKTQEAELFRLADLTRYWNPEWKLERAGFGGAGGGMRGIRGITHLDGDVLATYPRDEVRGLVLRRRLKLGAQPRLRFEAGTDAGRAWQLDVYVNNENRLSRRIEAGGSGGERHWESIDLDLATFAGQETEIRLYQAVLVEDRVAGNAYWRNLRVE
jgi:hypothetical protein